MRLFDIVVDEEYEFRKPGLNSDQYSDNMTPSLACQRVSKSVEC